MSTKIKIFIAITLLAFGAVVFWMAKKNKAAVATYKTVKPFKTNIEKNILASGKVIPLEEVEVKPQITGIIDKIVVDEGQELKVGDLIATLKVVPNIESLNRVNGRIRTAKINFENAKIRWGRAKKLLAQGAMTRQDFEQQELTYRQRKQELKNAQTEYDIIKKGTTAGMGVVANTNIRATTSGMLIDIPVKEGGQVIPSNNFNAGTTIASIADMSKMIFEGNVNESDVGYLKVNTSLSVEIAAIKGKKFKAILNFIAPKGNEVNGTINFKIKANIEMSEDDFIRAGYSANASITLDKKENVLAIKERLLQFDSETEAPYVEVMTSKGVFEKRPVELGISDGINVAILKGVKIGDEIKDLK